MAYMMVQVTPDSISFGNVGSGVTKRMHLMVRLKSVPEGLDEAIRLYIIPPTGVGCSPSGNVTLTPWDPVDLELTWTPSSPGSLDTYLEIQNLTQGGYKMIHLTGTCPAQATAAILEWPPLIDFGVVKAGTSASKMFLLANSQESSGNLTISSKTVIGGAGAFNADSPVSMPILLAPGQSVSLPTAFEPPDKGVYNAVLQIAHNGVNIPSPLSIILVGRGTDLYEFVSREYVLKDKSKARVTLKLHHKGVIAGYMDGNLSSYRVELADPGEGDMQTDLGELVTYPASRSFTMDDPDGFLANLLIEDEDTLGDIFVLYERQKADDPSWVTKIEGVLDYPIQFNDDLGDSSLTFNVTVGTDILSRLAFGDLFLAPGYNLDYEGWVAKFPTYDAPRYGRLSKVAKHVFSQTEKLVDILKFILAVVSYVTSSDPGGFDANTFSLDVDVPHHYAEDDGGANEVGFADLEVSANGLWISSADGTCTIADFLHSVCVGYGVRIEVTSATSGVIRSMFDAAETVEVETEAGMTGRDAEKHLHLEKNSATSKPITGIQVYFSGFDATILGIPPIATLTDVCNLVISQGYIDASKVPTFDLTQREVDNLAVIIPTSMKPYTDTLDGATFLKQSEATAQFWWKWLSGRKGNRSYLLTLMGLDYSFGSLMHFRGNYYFPIRMTERDKDCETDFELVKIS